MAVAYVYYLGLGSNIKPALHFSTALGKIQAKFGGLMVWPVITTSPVGIETPHAFCNTLVVVRSSCSPRELKRWTNAIEEECGRDRSDPSSPDKDRPLDIDILAQQSQLDLSILKQFKEPYIQAVVGAGKTHPTPDNLGLSWSLRHVLMVNGHPLTQCPATINAKHTAGHIMVIENGVDSLLQRTEPAL